MAGRPGGNTGDAIRFDVGYDLSSFSPNELKYMPTA
jgi:hypothetical protein